MLRIVFEELAALVALGLFLACVAAWAVELPRLITVAGVW